MYSFDTLHHTIQYVMPTACKFGEYCLTPLKESLCLNGKYHFLFSHAAAMCQIAKQYFMLHHLGNFSSFSACCSFGLNHFRQIFVMHEQYKEIK